MRVFISFLRDSILTLTHSLLPLFNIGCLTIKYEQAWKKIEETKKKAKDIMHVKQRNQEQIRLKEQRRREKDLEERMLLERNQNMKNNIKENITMTKEQLLKKQYDEAEKIKQEKREQAEQLMLFKQQEALKAASAKQKIRNAQMEAEEKRRLDQAEKKARTRAELQQRIIAENQRRLQIEVRFKLRENTHKSVLPIYYKINALFSFFVQAEVAMMEQEELELIKRLQNTQMMQKTAYDDLENALNGSFNREQAAQLQQQMMGANGDRGHTPVKGSVPNSSGRPQTSQSSSGVKYTNKGPVGGS